MQCDNLQHWDTENDVLSLLDVVRNVKPDIYDRGSGQTGLFTEDHPREMHKHCPRPIVVPLSNPTSRVEAATGHYRTDGQRAGGNRQSIRRSSGKIR